MHVTIDLFTKNDEILSKLSKYWLEMLAGGMERNVREKGGKWEDVVDDAKERKVENLEALGRWGGWRGWGEEKIKLGRE